jgi:hypothetical protein
MMIGVDELVQSLEKTDSRKDTPASHALWIRFSQEKTSKTVEYRSADGNQIVHVYLNRDDALVGVEIFP